MLPATFRRVLITGASSGIGHALAIEFAAKRTHLLLTARRQDRLETVAAEIHSRFPDYSTSDTPTTNGPRVVIQSGDITDNIVQDTLLQTAKNSFGGLDVLVNNAGVGATALIEKTSDSLNRQLFEVNYFALYNLTCKAIPLLRESAQLSSTLSSTRAQNRWFGGRSPRYRPCIVNLSSIVGLRGVPHFGSYGAAKFAVAGLSETLRAELAKDGIHVLLVCPGTTKTEFFDVLLSAESSPNLPDHSAVSARYVAARILRAVESGTHLIIPYPKAKVLYYLQRMCPSFVDWLMTKYCA